jgi:hypothetical protein
MGVGPSSTGLLQRLDGRLRGVDPLQLEDEARIAYWLNAYNRTLLLELSARPRSGHLLRHRRLFRRAAHTVGGLDYSLDVIEHGLLRRNRRPPFSARRLLRPGDPRLQAAPAMLDPRIHFALNCGARSCPPVRVYTDAVDSELEASARTYLAAESELDRPTATLTLPGLMRLYRGDFEGREGVLAFAVAHLGEDREWLAEHARELNLRFARFDWRIEEPAAA